MTVESQVEKIPGNTQIEIRPKQNSDPLKITSIVTETGLGIRFRNDSGVETSLTNINEEELDIQTFIDQDDYAVFESGDSNEHCGFYSAVSYNG